MSPGDKIALVENHCDRRQIRYRGGGQFGFFSLLFFFFQLGIKSLRNAHLYLKKQEKSTEDMKEGPPG